MYFYRAAARRPIAARPRPIPTFSLCEPAPLDAVADVPDAFIGVVVPDATDVVDDDDVALVAPVVPLLQDATAGNVTPEGAQMPCANC
jgi:hypothetical protein